MTPKRGFHTSDTAAPNLMALDMGGTTAKASIIEEGEMLQAPEYEVGGEISVGHRLLRGSGHILRVPAIDLAEVGAGGGSIAVRADSGPEASDQALRQVLEQKVERTG